MRLPHLQRRLQRRQPALPKVCHFDSHVREAPLMARKRKRLGESNPRRSMRVAESKAKKVIRERPLYSKPNSEFKPNKVMSFLLSAAKREGDARGCQVKGV